MQSLFLFGRQPALGLAEIEAIYGSDATLPVGNKAALLDVDPSVVDYKRLGGSIKFCKVLSILPGASWSEIEQYLLDNAPQWALSVPKGKLLLGLSAYGVAVTPSKMQATGLSIKKLLKKSERSVRFIPNHQLELSSAQVIHNHLTGPNGWELVFLRDESKIYVGQTVAVQDIEAYTKRDQVRPRRDAKVGMLPPKLAQMIINLAAGPSSPRETKPYQTVLDPFCGSGVILQEAILMGFSVYGTDSEQRMVGYTQENLAWLKGIYSYDNQVTLKTADATTFQWDDSFQLVASEVYLGRAFSSAPAADILERTASDCNHILKKFLLNLHHQIRPGTRLCLAVPAWQSQPGRFKHLPLIDQLGQLGYNRISLEHVAVDQLIYFRPDQFVARELLILRSI